jgi:hypothetical protein
MKNLQPSTATVVEVSPDRWKLQASELELSLDPAELGFRTTDELEPLDHVHGQDRAIHALEFGLDRAAPGLQHLRLRDDRSG